MLLRTLAATIGIAFGAPLTALANPADPFYAESAAAMDKMMADMSEAPTGDVDVDFVNMMEPHHAGAVAMAVQYLRYGRNEQLRRIAQEIIIEQRQEVDAMRVALGRPTLPAGPVPTQSSPVHSNHEHRQEPRL